MFSPDKIRRDQGFPNCYGKWLGEGAFSVTNLGNLDRIRHNQDLADGGSQAAEISCKSFQVESDKRCGEHVVNDACIAEVSIYGAVIVR